MIALPGVATPTEAFTALAAGADGLKMFPGELLPPVAVKAWRAVLPRNTLLVPTGGVTPDNVAAYRAAGADAFGIGSALYKPGISRDELAKRAAAFIAALR
jgi:2-dehydro-3-deoxyphosphogalactonate aldolase